MLTSWPLRALGRVLLALAGVGAAFSLKTGQHGWLRLEPDQVAVVVDYVRGGSRVVAEPGLLFYVPYLGDVRVLDRAASTLSLCAESKSHAHPLPKLNVRAADGTLFSFDDLEIAYRVDAAQAQVAVVDSQARPGLARTLVVALTRGILSEELGRATAEEIVAGAELDEARAAALQRLNEALAPHALRVLDVPAAMPRFDAEYESQALRRRVAEQHVAMMGTQRRKLEMELEQRLSAARRAKEIERTVLSGKLEQQRLAAETAAIERRRVADIYALDRVEGARVARQALEERAVAQTARFRAEVEGFAALVAATGGQSDGGGDAASSLAVVRKAWVDKLSDVEFELLPFELERPSASGIHAKDSPR